MYHINPTTGAVSKCRAKKGNCPFEESVLDGGTNHFETFAEAQAQADRMLGILADILPVDTAGNEEFEDVDSYDYEYLADLREDDLLDLLSTTEDEDLQLAVLYRDTSIVDDRNAVRAVIANPNLTSIFRDDVIDNPMKYTKFVQVEIARMGSMSKAEILNMFSKTEHKDVKVTLMERSEIGENEIRYVFERDPDAVVSGDYEGMGYNPNVPDDLAPKIAKMKREKLKREDPEAYARIMEEYKDLL